MLYFLRLYYWVIETELIIRGEIELFLLKAKHFVLEQLLCAQLSFERLLRFIFPEDKDD